TVADGVEVTLENFTIAGTDKHMSEHSAERDVNTIRQSREPSGPDHQFVINEKKDVVQPCSGRHDGWRHDCQSRLG
ncbi:MAG: hypothetical protein AAF922_15640, partial [Pseudomonadota bacterium]